MCRRKAKTSCGTIDKYCLAEVLSIHSDVGVSEFSNRQNILKFVIPLILCYSVIFIYCVVYPVNSSFDFSEEPGFWSKNVGGISGAMPTQPTDVENKGINSFSVRVMPKTNQRLGEDQYAWSDIST